MKNFLLKYAKNPILVIFLLIVLIYGVPALSKTSNNCLNTTSKEFLSCSTSSIFSQDFFARS